MARSKSGGTRSFLRGRVGADVYSIGKDAKGKKQQVVRSLAESVANPQTLAQMRGRMIMSTVMQAVSAMSQIIDHSFDNVSVGQPNVSEFIRRNYAAVKADVSAHPTEGNAFGLAMYGEKGIKQGAYIVSAGSALPATGIVVDGAAKTLTIALSAGATIADLRSALGLGVSDYFTAVAITADKKFVFVRFHVATALADDTAISAQNIAEVISTDGNISVNLAFASNTITATFGAFSANYGIIVSRKENSIYKHNDCVLVAVSDPSYNSDTALPSYPVGTTRFLNGGGEDQGQVEPEPVPAVFEVTSLTADGNAVEVGAYYNKESGTVAVAGTVANKEDGKVYKIQEQDAYHAGEWSDKLTISGNSFNFTSGTIGMQSSWNYRITVDGQEWGMLIRLSSGD